MHLQRLVAVHRVEARHIEAGNPHIDDDGNFEIRLVFLKLKVEFLALIVCAQQVV